MNYSIVIQKLFYTMSFPRRRESRWFNWIPAFAGMTAVIIDHLKYHTGLWFLIIVFVLQAPVALAQEFYTTPEVLTLLFPKSEFVKPTKHALTLFQMDSIKKILKSPEVKQDWIFYTATTKSHKDGYALIDQVRGKEKSFTYVVAFTPDGRVSNVEILLYRESHGSQIRNRAFRKQFTGKSSGDQLKLGQDIRNVSGATISARSITFGVKRATLVWNEIYKKR